MFEAVENRSISQIIIEQIQNMIIKGELKVGDKLPAERQLTEMLNVGRPALREALKALEVIGLIERRHGQGNFISNNIENSFYKPLSLSFKLNNGSVEDILNLREAIESFTIRESSLKATADDIKRLYEIHYRMISEKNDDRKAEFDRQLHYEIAKISGNKLIIYLLESISYLMETFIDKAVHISLYRENSIEKIYEEHLNIIKSIENHDVLSSAKAINDHLRKINIELLKENQ